MIEKNNNDHILIDVCIRQNSDANLHVIFIIILLNIIFKWLFGSLKMMILVLKQSFKTGHEK